MLLDGSEVVAGGYMNQQTSRTNDFIAAKKRQFGWHVAHVLGRNVHLAAQILIEADRSLVPNLLTHARTHARNTDSCATDTFLLKKYWVAQKQ